MSVCYLPSNNLNEICKEVYNAVKNDRSIALLSFFDGI